MLPVHEGAEQVEVGTTLLVFRSRLVHERWTRKINTVQADGTVDAWRLPPKPCHRHDPDKKTTDAIDMHVVNVHVTWRVGKGGLLKWGPWALKGFRRRDLNPPMAQFNGVVRPGIYIPALILRRPHHTRLPIKLRYTLALATFLSGTWVLPVHQQQMGIYPTRIRRIHRT